MPSMIDDEKTDTLAPAAHGVADQLNRECFCVTLDHKALGDALRAESGDAAFCEQLVETRPHLFAQAPVFLPKADGQGMGAIVQAIESVIDSPSYRAAVQAWAPEIARIDHGPRGAFMGFDFHLCPEGPKLIEINTNAGGAFLNAFLGRAQIACCAEVERGLARASLDAFETAVVTMFESEWRRQGRQDPLRRIAIVDDAPEEQYLHTEFVLAKRLFERHKIHAVIVDPSTLTYDCGALQHRGMPIDLVYNRLVDFDLDEPRHRALRDAYADGAVVVTPNPHNHALFADKRNLTLLSDPNILRSWNVETSRLSTLAAGVPHTVRLSSGNADQLWDKRKRLFFKPTSGHGGKAVYRGDKLTKGVWSDILSGDYVAQELVPPSERTIEFDGARVQRKLDVRLYTYAGETLLAAARLYQGQTTNFRTPGGGFATVFFI